MRARIYTPAGTLGFVDLVDGAEVADVVRAMRDHRLFITPADPAWPRTPADATTLPAQTADELTLPGDRTLDAGAKPKHRRTS